MTYKVDQDINLSGNPRFKLVRQDNQWIESFNTKLAAEFAATALNLASVLDDEDYDKERQLEYVKAVIDVTHGTIIIEEYENGNQ